MSTVRSVSPNVAALRTRAAWVSDGEVDAAGDNVSTLPCVPSVSMPDWPYPLNAEIHWPWAEPSVHPVPCGRDEKSAARLPLGGVVAPPPDGGVDVGAVVVVVRGGFDPPFTDFVVEDGETGPATVVLELTTGAVVTVVDDVDDDGKENVLDVDVGAPERARGVRAACAWAPPTSVVARRPAMTRSGTIANNRRYLSGVPADRSMPTHRLMMTRLECALVTCTLWSR